MAGKSIVNSVESKVSELIERHLQLRRKTAELQARCDKLKAKNRELTLRIAEAEKRIATLELSEGLSGEASDRKRARARVNRLMREIDKGISLLNK